jgi:pimeloyl-ACP methyl ester carboxylesterase
MTGRTWAGVVGVAAFAVVSAGCTCCRNRALDDALAADDAIETCAANRNDVYTFVLGGIDPFDTGPDRLAEGLNGHGFAKVYTGTRFHAGWFAKEVRRLAEENPTARFAVVGRRGGAARAAELAAQLAHDGLPIDAFVLINPDGFPATGYDLGTVETRVVQSADERTEVPAVAAVLAGVARHIPTEAAVRVIQPLDDDPAPVPELVADSPGRSNISK